MKTRTQLTLSAAVVAAAAGAASAQDGSYPSKPLRFVVGQSPGGATDIVARLVANKMTEVLGQNVLVENRTGAAGSIAAAGVARGAPDGHTVLVVSSSYSINPSIYARLPFDPQKDLATVSLLAEAPFLLVVHPSLPTRNVKELIALAKAQPGVLTFGSGGVGSSGHLAGALFETGSGVQLSHVPYKGAGQALIDLLGGQITFMFASVLSSAPHVKQQRLRVLGVTRTKRSQAFPEVPTIAEAGVPGYSTGSWYGLLVAASTPKALIEKQAGGANKVMMSPEVRDRITHDGAEPVGSTPVAFQSHLAAEISKWRDLVKRIGLKTR